MTRRVIVINEYAHTLDAREGIKRVPVRSLRVGDALSSGEKITAVHHARDGKTQVTITKNGYPRFVHWTGDAQVSIVNRDGVGSIEEQAYGEGWHSESSANPYTDAEAKAAWEKGRAAKRQKFKMNSNARAGEVRGKRFDPPKAKVAADYKSEKGFVAKLIDVKTGNTLARSEPHISNGIGLKNWIQGEAAKLIQQGKRVKAEVAVVFFDPNMAHDRG